MKWIKIQVKTGSRTELIDITSRISEELTKTGVLNGTFFVYMPHTTAGLTINENADPDVVRDILAGLARLCRRKVITGMRKGFQTPISRHR